MQMSLYVVGPMFQIYAEWSQIFYACWAFGHYVVANPRYLASANGRMAWSSWAAALVTRCCSKQAIRCKRMDKMRTIDPVINRHVEVVRVSSRTSLRLDWTPQMPICWLFVINVQGVCGVPVGTLAKGTVLRRNQLDKVPSSVKSWNGFRLGLEAQLNTNSLVSHRCGHELSCFSWSSSRFIWSFECVVVNKNLAALALWDTGLC